jgi:FdhE protein
MTTTTIIQPGEIARPVGEIPFLHLPEKGAVFHDRAARLRMLAQDHTLKEYLLFAASVCDAQHDALRAFPDVPLPSEQQLALCREHGMPPLSVQSWQRDPAWQGALRQITARLDADANLATRETLARLQQMDGAALETLADAILAGRYGSMDLAVAPFVAAALQVYWTHMATSLGDRAFGRSDVASLCPVCASHPASSIVRIGGAEQGLRYLNCSLCETQWHMVRVKCTNCESTKGIAYYSIEGASGAVKAESCDQCHTYLKIAYMEKDPHVDPIADDVATLALDLMMDDSGKSRSGPNLFLMTASDSAE